MGSDRLALDELNQSSKERERGGGGGGGGGGNPQTLYMCGRVGDGGGGGGGGVEKVRTCSVLDKCIDQICPLEGRKDKSSFRLFPVL